MTEPVLTPLYTENSNLATYLDALSLNNGERNYARNSNDRFWSTDERPGSDTTQDVLEVSFSIPQYLNYISFDLARFPHTAAVEYLDEEDLWQPVLEKYGNVPLVYRIGESYPPVVNGGFLSDHLHPQHGYEGHWRSLKTDIKTVKAYKIRVVLQRIPSNFAPRNRLGVFIDYSLAVRNLDIGYLVTSHDSVPNNAKYPVDAEPGAFTYNVDLLNSTQGYLYRENKADFLGQDNKIWRSEPQPYATAVVNLYADVRDETGKAKLVDRIFIDPVTTGCHLSLYFSNDDSSYSFSSKSEPLPISIIENLGESLAVDTGRLNLTSNSAISINLNALSFNLSNSWWIGTEIFPMISPSDVDPEVDSSYLPVYNFDGISVQLVKDYLCITNENGDSFEVPVEWYSNQPIRLLIGYDQESYYIGASTFSDTVTQTYPVTVPLPENLGTKMILGKLGDDNRLIYRMTSFVIKEEYPDFHYLDEPEAYSTVPEFSVQESETSRWNSLVRFDPYLDGHGTLGFYGGSADRYSSMIWTPVNRNYILNKGDLKLPLTKAKYWKFEITNLQPQYFDIYQPVTRDVLSFPPSVLKQYIASQVVRTSASEVGIDQSQFENGSTYFQDYATAVGTGSPVNGYPSTAVYTADNYETGQKISKLGNQWNYRSWHTDQTAPSWVKVGRHDYVTTKVQHTEKVAYFAAVNSVKFKRNNYLAAYSYPLYDQVFSDTKDYDPGNWQVEPNSISSGESDYVQAVSKVYPTVDGISALQFSAQQTDSVQILPDDNFTNPLAYWENFGDGYIVPSSINKKTAMVNRDVTVGYWESIEEEFDQWPLGLTFGELGLSTTPTQVEGGISLIQTIQVPEGGSLYAAARIFADDELHEPLWVQIVDADTDTIISEQSAEVDRNHIAEWFTSMNISNSKSTPTKNLYKDLSSNDDHDAFFDYFSRNDNSNLGTAKSGQGWEDDGHSMSIVSGVATCNGNQENYVDLDSQWGRLDVTMGNVVWQSTPTNFRRVINLGGFYVMNNGWLVSDNVAAPLDTLGFTPASGDTVGFAIMPSKKVPSGQQSTKDAEIYPYSILVYRNGTYVKTMAVYGSLTYRKGLSGANGQTFTQISWAPSQVKAFALPELRKFTLPPTTDDDVVEAPELDIFYTNKAQAYLFSDSSPATPYHYYGGSSEQNFATDFGFNLGDSYSDFGTLEISIKQAPTANLPGVLLKFGVGGQQIWVLTTGQVITSDFSVVYATGAVNLSGLNDTNRVIAAHLLSVRDLSTSFKTAHSIPNTDSKVVVITQGGAVTAVFSGDDQLWLGNYRGVGGNNSANPATAYKWEGLSWYPAQTEVKSTDGQALWGELDYDWSSLEDRVTPAVTNIKIRVIQKGITKDAWEVDRVSLYHNPIIWEFSHDAGRNWYPANDIRSNPYGVLQLPSPKDLPANMLQWRVTAFKKGVQISDLTIRPWYRGEYIAGVASQLSQAPDGPNLVNYDTRPGVGDDPRFKVWSKPIPRDWWFSFMNNYSSQETTTDLISDEVVDTQISSAIVIGR